ncbi:hypothetical protein DC74_2488 [Streptomyces noursei]|nr:hypothetical protein DC74_2488 [Streptomyces noursei]
MYTFTDAPHSSTSRSAAAASAAPRPSAARPQCANHPHQNSMHINGPRPWCRRNAANASRAPDPKFTVANTPGTLPPVNMWSSAPSEVHSGTVTPNSRNRRVR